jgi:hypothetical protein
MSTSVENIANYLCSISKDIEVEVVLFNPTEGAGKLPIMYDFKVTAPAKYAEKILNVLQRELGKVDASSSNDARTSSYFVTAYGLGWRLTLSGSGVLSTEQESAIRNTRCSDQILQGIVDPVRIYQYLATYAYHQGADSVAISRSFGKDVVSTRPVILIETFRLQCVKGVIQHITSLAEARNWITDKMVWSFFMYETGNTLFFGPEYKLVLHSFEGCLAPGVPAFTLTYANSKEAIAKLVDELKSEYVLFVTSPSALRGSKHKTA